MQLATNMVLCVNFYTKFILNHSTKNKELCWISPCPTKTNFFISKKDGWVQLRSNFRSQNEHFHSKDPIRQNLEMTRILLISVFLIVESWLEVKSDNCSTSTLSLILCLLSKHSEPQKCATVSSSCLLWCFSPCWMSSCKYQSHIFCRTNWMDSDND